MSGYSSVFWLSLCASLTALGLVLSIAVGRRRGFRSLLRGAAWSLIPIAAYMTGSTLMFWRIGDAIGKFGSGFVFSTLRWAGIGVAGLAVVLFLASGGRERRKAARAARAGRLSRKKTAAAGPSASGGTSALPATRPTGRSGAELARTEAPAAEPSKPKPSKAERRQQAGSAKGGPRGDDDLAEVEEILRKRGL